MNPRISPALCVVWLGAVVLCVATWAGVWLLVRQMPGMDAGRLCLAGALGLFWMAGRMGR